MIADFGLRIADYNNRDARTVAGLFLIRNPQSEIRNREVSHAL